MLTVAILDHVKTRLTNEELEDIRKPQREPFRFQIEDENKKVRFNAYRIKLEEGLRYCNRECNKLYDSYDGTFILRVFTKVSNTQFREIATLQRTKEQYFDEWGYEEESSL